MNKTKRLLTTAMTAALIGMQAFANDYLTMIVGTYTDASTSDGMYVYRFNQDNGKAQAMSNVKAGNPSFLAISEDGKHVYAVNEYDDDRRGISAFNLDTSKGTMSFINRQKTGTLLNRHPKNLGGAAPCNVMLFGKHVVTSNYDGGDLSAFLINDDGSVGEEAQYSSNFRAIPGNDGHMHCCIIAPDEHHMLAADLGNDCIWSYYIHPEYEGGFIDRDHRTEMAYKAPKGTGPRHLIFNKKGNIVYLIGELDGSITVLAYNDGKLKELQRIQASQTKTSGSADIHLSPDGKFLYASHRLKDDGVSIFSVNPSTGLLKKIGYQPTALHPRNFAITPNGKYLLVACRDSNVIEVYRRNLNTGKLTNTKQNIKLGKPVCIQFTDK